MSNTQDKKRMAGSALKTAAWLMEASLTGPMLYKTAIKQLGLTELHEMNVPSGAVPYRPFHLAPSSPPGNMAAGSEQEVTDE